MKHTNDMLNMNQNIANGCAQGQDDQSYKINTSQSSEQIDACQFKSVKDQATVFTDMELLANLLPSSSQLTAQQRANNLLAHYGSISGLLDALPSDLHNKFGISRSVVKRIFCAVELGKRVLINTPVRGDVLDSPQRVKNYLKLEFANKKREEFLVLFLDNRSRFIQSEVLFKGTIDNAVIHPREVVRRCFELCAAAIIVAHNHPSGESKPSEADQRITKKLQIILKSVNILIIDHIVIGAGTTTSFAEAGLLRHGE